MTPKAAAPSIGELEQELESLQPKLYTLFAAQQNANDDLFNAEAAKGSATGEQLTDVILAARKYRVEVERFTDEIAPLKERAQFLRREIDARKRTDVHREGAGPRPCCSTRSRRRWLNRWRPCSNTSPA